MLVTSVTSRHRQWCNDPDVFRYTCGECMSKYCFNVLDFTKSSFKAHISIKLGDLFRSCAPTAYSLWFAMSPRITMMIVVFACLMCQDRIKTDRSHGTTPTTLTMYLNPGFKNVLKYQFSTLPIDRTIRPSKSAMYMERNVLAIRAVEWRTSHINSWLKKVGIKIFSKCHKRLKNSLLTVAVSFFFCTKNNVQKILILQNATLLSAHICATATVNNAKYYWSTAVNHLT